MRQRGWLAAVIIAVSVLSLTACTGDTSSNNASPAKSDLPPLSFSKQPLWTSDNHPDLRYLDDVAVKSDSVITLDVLDDTLAVFDAATGKLRWQVKQHAKLPGVSGRYANLSDAHSVITAGDGDDWTLLVPYTSDCTPECDSYDANPEFGVAAYAGRSGKLRWTAPIAHKSDHLGKEVLPLAANPKMVVSVVGSIAVDDPTKQPVVVATSMSDGKKLWQSKGMWPQQIVGDTVLGARGKSQPDPARPLGTGTPDAMPLVGSGDTVVALNANNGTKKWESHGGVGLVLANDKIAVVEEQNKVRAVDIETGKELADFGERESCGGNGVKFVVCLSLDEMVVYDVATNRSTKHNDLPATHLNLVFGDYIVVYNNVLDRDGKKVAGSDIPAVDAMSDQYAATVSKDANQRTTLRVYGVKIG
ncbi:MAG: PQQ-binding-like beta-propeller repeat protein [Mycobacterium sp.]|nr:PQQ-binding-like beta-propeller repeat protein [Mycobacterium sp.]